MTEPIITTNISGQEVISVVNEDGSGFSMLKEEYDKLNASKK